MVIKAFVLRVIPDSIVTIRQYDLESNILMSEVAEIVYSGPVKSENGSQNGMAQDSRTATGRPLRSNYIRKNIPDSGWHLGLQLGASFGTKSYGASSSFVFRANLLKTQGRFLYGLNTGLDPYLYTGNLLWITAAEGRYHFTMNKPKSFLLNLSSGYGFNLSSPRLGNDGGFLFSSGIGHSHRTRDGNVFSVLLSYKFQSMKSQVTNWMRDTRTEYYKLHRTEIKVEWRF